MNNYALDLIKQKIESQTIESIKQYLLDKPRRSLVSRDELTKISEGFFGKIMKCPPAKRKAEECGLNRYSFGPQSKKVSKKGSMPTGAIIQHMEVAVR